MTMLFRAAAASLLAALPFFAWGQDAAAATAGAGAGAADVEALVATLENPEDREALISDLRTLLETQRQAEAPATPNELGATDVVTWVRAWLTDIWKTITAIDPREIVIAGLLTIAILIGAVALRWLLLRLLRRLYQRLQSGTPEPAAGAGDSADGVQTGMDGDQASSGAAELPPTLVRLVNLVVAVIAVALIAETWGAGVGQLLQSDLGARLIEAALSIGMILVITSVLWNVSGIVVRRALTLGTGRQDRERTARRLDTLAPLLRSVLQVTIGVLSGLLILSELGINIGPLLAGAGILGLAVGFGAQTLVKDLITGVTILLEDSASVGDVVEIAGHAGAVEEMRIRVIQLRDLGGDVHLIPYSEVTSIINKTKDFSYYLMDVGVAYREDTDEVCGVLHEVCETLRQDETFGPDIQNELEILGVNRFADSAVEIRARIRTNPGRQWAVGRQFNRRMKKAFDERGIEIPFPHTTLYFGEPKSGSAPPARLAVEQQPESA